jgi:hypothetical protein
MRDRKEDWRDILTGFTLALDAKKVCMGFVAVLGTLLVLFGFSWLHSWLLGTGNVANFVDPQSPSFVLTGLLEGRRIAITTAILPLLNPFAGGILHFVISVVMYTLLFAIWSFFAGVITRIAALEYGRDDLPLLNDGTSMARAKYKAYFLSVLSPLIGITIFALLNALGGLLGSIPYLGPILMIIGIIPWFISTAILVFLIFIGVLSFGLIAPNVSIGGKDAFEAWSSAFSYVLWGFKRFVGYTVLAGVVGLLATTVACLLCELFIYGLVNTINIGMVASYTLVQYDIIGGGQFGPVLGITDSPAFLMRLSSAFLLIALAGVRLLPLAYLFSYFFTTNTIICFLLRKNVDRIEIDEVYEEEEEEDQDEEEFIPEEPAEETAETEEADSGEVEETEEETEKEEQEEIQTEETTDEADDEGPEEEDETPEEEEKEKE